MPPQGFVRPGCTNLILDLLFSDRGRLGALFAPGATEPWVVGNGLARRVLGSMGMSLRDGVTLQYGSTVRPFRKHMPQSWLGHPGVHGAPRHKRAVHSGLESAAILAVLCTRGAKVLTALLGCIEMPVCRSMNL